MDADELAENPKNWKVHPDRQITLMDAALKEHGWVAPLIYNETTGRLIDGHMRKGLRPGQQVPVMIGHWSEQQEHEILLDLDLIGALFETDQKMFEEAAKEYKTEDVNLQELITELMNPLSNLTMPDGRLDKESSDNMVIVTLRLGQDRWDELAPIILGWQESGVVVDVA